MTFGTVRPKRGGEIAPYVLESYPLNQDLLILERMWE